MKTFYRTATILLTLLSFSCSESFEIPVQEPTWDVLLQSRSISESNTLPEGSTALFNIRGGLELTNQIFTYNNQSWQSEESIEWNNGYENSALTAIHPVLEEYTSGTLYEENRLTDILIAQDTLTSGNRPEITFRHLFASLTVTINEVLQKELHKIRLTVPQTIASVDPANGYFTTETSECTISKSHDGNAEYRFIIPPMEEAVLNIELITSEGCTYSHFLTPHTFQSGYNYSCKILKKDQRPGIRTADDLIAFSLLINKQTYTGNKKLTDFGDESDGRTTYRLLSDITLTDEQCQQFLPIGYYDSRTFQDIFDGEGHCIYNFTLPDKSTNSKTNLAYSGLFGHISTSGTVKNLSIKQAKTIENSTCTRIGFIAALNEGIISNCQVEESSIYPGEHYRTGFICGQLSTQGTIVNCHTSKNDFTTENSFYVGGIVGYANGKILNCYTSNNHYQFSAENSDGGGGIAGYSSTSYQLTIANCYTYHTEKNDPYWALMESAQNVSVSHFFYNQGTLYNASNSSKVSQKDVYKYDDSFQVNGKPISYLLNEWITNTGSIEYPEIDFSKWSTNDGNNVSFEP